MNNEYLICGFIYLIPTILFIFAGLKFHQGSKIFKKAYVIVGILFGLISALYFIESILSFDRTLL